MIGLKPKYLFPSHSGNQFHLLIDGDQFYPVMLKAIEAARAYVLLELYLFESGTVAGRFIDSLLAAAKRGVDVYLLLDDFGASGLLKRDRLRLEQGGVKVDYYNPLRYGLHYTGLLGNLFRDHRKLLLADGAIAFTGGAGITDEFDPLHNPHRRWRETMIEIKGPVVQDWQDVFETNWRHSTGEKLNLKSPAPLAGGTQRGRVVLSQGPGHAEIKRSLLNRIRHAAQRIWIATAYFVPSRKLLRALRAAATRGVDVRLLLPGPHTDHPAIRHAGRRYYYYLLHHDIRVFEYQPRFTHSKVLLCDDWVSIGSSNVDRWNLYWNLEANQEIDDPPFAKNVHAMFVADFQHCREFHLEEWRRRPWYRRLLERFWGWVDIRIERITKRRRPGKGR